MGHDALVVVNPKCIKIQRNFTVFELTSLCALLTASQCILPPSKMYAHEPKVALFLTLFRNVPISQFCLFPPLF